MFSVKKLAAAIIAVLLAAVSLAAPAAADAEQTKVSFVTADGSTMQPGTYLEVKYSQGGRTYSFEYRQGATSMPSIVGTGLPLNGKFTVEIAQGPGYGMDDSVSSAQRTVSGEAKNGQAVVKLPRAHNVTVNVQQPKAALKSPVLEVWTQGYNTDHFASDEDRVKTFNGAKPGKYVLTLGTGTYYARYFDKNDRFISGVSGSSGLWADFKEVTVPKSKTLTVTAVKHAKGTLKLKVTQEGGDQGKFYRLLNFSGPTGVVSYKIPKGQKNITLQLAPGVYSIEGFSTGTRATFNTLVTNRTDVAYVEVKANKTTKATLDVMTWAAPTKGKKSFTFNTGNLPYFSDGQLYNARYAASFPVIMGQTRFDYVHNGTYKLAVSGHATKKKVTVRNGKIVGSKKLKTSGPRITGTISTPVSDKSGHPVILRNAKNNKVVSVAYTDTKGTYKFVAVPAGKYRVSLYGRDGMLGKKWTKGALINTASKSVTIKKSTKTKKVNLKLKSVSTLTVKVVDASGKPVKNAAVSLQSGSLITYSGASTTNGKGRVVLTGTPRTTILVSASGDLGFTASKKVKLSKKSQTVTLKLKATY